MATKAKRLKMEARAAATWHGHKLGRFKKDEDGYYYAECTVCGAAVVVAVRPRPNEAELMGSVVAIGCGEE